MCLYTMDNLLEILKFRKKFQSNQTFLSKIFLEKKRVNYLIITKRPIQPGILSQAKIQIARDAEVYQDRKRVGDVF